MTLAEQQATMIASILANAEVYVLSHYDIFTLQSCFLLMQNAQSHGLTNRAAYIGQLNTWFMSVLTYVGTTQAAISAAADQPTLSAIAWNFPSNFDSTDPAITIAGALAINN
jgi:hypothetical protein